MKNNILSILKKKPKDNQSSGYLTKSNQIILKGNLNLYFLKERQEGFLVVYLLTYPFNETKSN